jgi:phage FluMu protein Com
MPEPPAAALPTRCEDCGKRLMLLRPGRTRCEACAPTMRGVNEILRSREETTTQADRPAATGPVPTTPYAPEDQP